MSQNKLPTPTPTYTLTLSGSQLEVVNQALDLTSRLGIGQFDKILNLPGMDKGDAVVSLSQLRSRDGFAILGNPEIRVDHLLSLLHIGMTGLHPNASHKIRHPNTLVFYRKAYDLHQVIRKRLAEDRGCTGWNVDLNDFMRSEPDEPIAIITKVENK